MSTAPPSQSCALTTAQKFISHFTTFNASILHPILSETYTHEFRPLSLNPPGPFGRTGFLNHVGGLSDVMTGFPVYADEYIEGNDGTTVIVRATSKTQFKEEVKDPGLSREEWEYAGEYVFFFEMDEAGEKVVRCVEFLDSMATVGLLELVKRARGNLERLQMG
ncbi:uncharacterized protein BDV14DRAFT_211960 [Aspergillus stella-maris]|uniref:uncharacterized protein n=1 Tax=Aspergillus stella-maris TaxID=1810926 RepID=UPI003CCCCFB2